MSRSYLTQKEKQDIQNHLDDGKDVKWIALTLSISYNKVYYFREQSLIRDRHLMSRKKQWTKEEVNLLESRFHDLPETWRPSKQFRDLCRELNRTKSSVEQKCKQLGLSKKEGAFYKAPVATKIRRPDPVYTNTRTPYGIASELHRDNRIY